VAEFDHIFITLKPWIREYGVAAVFVILTFESFGVPLPGESLLIVAAILAAHGDISFPSLFISAWAGAVIGDNIGYLIGWKFGHKLVWQLGGKIGLSAERLAGRSHLGIALDNGRAVSRLTWSGHCCTRPETGDIRNDRCINRGGRGVDLCVRTSNIWTVPELILKI
jgi:hypothetical protein